MRASREQRRWPRTCAGRPRVTTRSRPVADSRRLGFASITDLRQMSPATDRRTDGRTDRRTGSVAACGRAQLRLLTSDRAGRHWAR